MTIRKTAYDTTACDGYIVDKIIAPLKTARASGWLVSDVNGYNILTVNGGSSFIDEIPQFSHPIIGVEKTIPNPGNKEIEQLAVDVRVFGKWDKDQNEFIIKNNTEYSFALHRARLNDIWINHEPNTLRDISPTPMAIYAAWISESVGRRFALDPMEQLNLAILSGIFYSSQFHNKNELSEEDKLKLINNVARTVRASPANVMAIVDKAPIINSVKDFCNISEEITGSVRMREFNPGLLFAILGGTWYGSVNARELVAVAIEHPPTWITILLYAFNDRSFHHSQIAKICERNFYRDMGKDYVRAVLHLLKTMGN